MNETKFRRKKDLPSTHLLGTGTPMCAGCGGLEAIHQIYDILGENTVFINAAGCMTLLSVYPFTLQHLPVPREFEMDWTCSLTNKE